MGHVLISKPIWACNAILFLLCLAICFSMPGCALHERMKDKSPRAIGDFRIRFNTLLDSGGESVAQSSIHKDDQERVLNELRERGLLQPNAVAGIQSHTSKFPYEVEMDIYEIDRSTGRIVKRVVMVFVKGRLFWRLTDVFG